MWLILLLILSVVFIVLATSRFRLHPFLALLLAAFGYGLLCGRMSLKEIVDSVNTGFGGTIGAIGIVILAGSVIGIFLEKSGGAGRIADSALKLTGKKNVPLAMGAVGYVVSIPVFCDSGFVILSPLSRALSHKAGISLAGSAVALSLGLYATHTMVPPTPGPVAAAGVLEADLGLVVLYGLAVSLFALLAGWLFAVNMGSRVWIDPTDDRFTAASQESDEAASPSIGRSIAPILLPILLIVLRSLAEVPSLNRPFGEGAVAQTIGFLGQPVVALLLGVFLAFLLPRKLESRMLSSEGWVGEAVVAAASIIVITGAGGAFGKVLQNAGIAQIVEEVLGGKNLGIWLPFLISAALKTAQGSSTVALIATAGIVAPLLPTLGLDYPSARALAVVAIGAGAMVVSHANDSYFWVVTQFSGMNVRQGYRLQTLGTLVEGTAAACAVWLLSLILV